jgi:glycosyltransferase involved in cell wall biosynthesis
MKIVHVMNSYIPNMGYQENNLPAEQKKLGHDVFIITSDHLPSYEGFNNHIGRVFGDKKIGIGEFSDKEISIYRLPCILEYKRHGQIIFLGLKKKLMELKPDIVHAHSVFSPSTLQTIYHSRKGKYHVVVDDHCNIDNFFPNSIMAKSYLEIVKRFYKIYDKNVSRFLPVTYSSKTIIQSFLKLPEDKIALLHLGVDANVFKKSKELRKKGRKEYDIKDDEIILISSGKFTQKKDIHILIKTFENINKKYSNIKLLLIGNGSKEYMRYLKDLVDALMIKEKVIFHDFVMNIELPKLYNAADIGVWPGTHTITAIEATATGLPVIIPSYNPAYSILFDNQSALSFKRGDIYSLFEKISILIEDRKKREIISINALKLVEKELSWETIGRKSIEIYSKALED